MRTETLRIRLSEDELRHYTACCEKLKVAPSTKARELLQDFVRSISTTESMCNSNAIPMLHPGKLTVGEMFSGPGGIGIALNRAHTSHYSFEHLWATDYDSDTCRTYQANVLKRNPSAKVICEDVRKLDIDSLPPVDGFLYGFPCNDFSNVGESKGLNGHFGGLYSYGVRYIDRVNPLFFFAENVSGLSSANEGRAFKKILTALNHAGKYGYTITAHLYKFEEYGVPQARHRYILIGIRGDLGIKFSVPKPSGIMKTCKEALQNIPPDASKSVSSRSSSHNAVIVHHSQNFTKKGTTSAKRPCPPSPDSGISRRRSSVSIRGAAALQARAWPSDEPSVGQRRSDRPFLRRNRIPRRQYASEPHEPS